MTGWNDVEAGHGTHGPLTGEAGVAQRLMAKAFAPGPGDKPRSAIDVQFGEDVIQVRLDRGLAQDEGPGDLTIGQAVGHQTHHLNLPPGETPRWVAHG